MAFDRFGSRRSPLTRLRLAIGDRLAVDARALAAFRIGLGLTVFLDVLLRVRHLTAFYTDGGVLPRAVLATHHPLSAALSPFALSGMAWVQVALFALLAAAGLALATGYRTRIATAASLLLLLSVHARNPYVLNGGDLVLRHLLFWSLLLPLGGRWSLDAARPGERPLGGQVRGLPADGLLLQVVAVYAVNALWKAKGEAWLAGDAVRYVFGVEMFTARLGPALTDNAALLVGLDYGWLLLVACSPLLVLTTGWRRLALVAAFVGAHVGMWLTMRLGLFPLVMVVALFPFLPPLVWDRLAAIDLAGRWERTVRPLSHPGTWRPARTGRLSIFGSPGGRRTGLGADGRLAVGELGPRARRVATIVAALGIAGMVVWHAAALGAFGTAAATGEDGSVAPAEHSWRMFAPDPIAVDVDYRASVTFADGTGSTTLDLPRDASARWRKYLGANVPSADWLVDPLVAHQCDVWERRYGAAVEHVRLVEIETVVVLDGPDTASERVRYAGACPGG